MTSIPRASAGQSEQRTASQTKLRLQDFLEKEVHGLEGGKELAAVFLAVQEACKGIAERLSHLGIDDGPALTGGGESGASASGRDVAKPMDIVANDLLKDALLRTGCVAVLASEEDEEPVVGSEGGKFVVAFDPLDGSRNIDAGIPTGTIFGIHRVKPSCAAASSPEWCQEQALQPGRDLLAAGYALYSSATMLVISVGHGAHGFTLNRRLGEWVLTHPDMKVPRRGQIYSLNDARYFDWPAGLQRYIDTVRQGKGQSGKQYSARYVCSLVADLHRTLLYGGWAGNPRSHLRLLYEANPLSFVAEQAGGKGSDGKRDILDIVPSALHQRLPFFVGSVEDIEELVGYGDVQQGKNPGYTV
ncbi:Fructose-1,6-bisphosphatase [Klebsormidium nitens]|uniref:fructose-bisphosphatase n=1 Tax=Klebsormidium nitens TaxID=105231 RepID=A0A1Y1HUE5_KLENI|nr:Fructose-1,6-bisphosphatase [Klebsormidium nitens]|eukprot:GAQ82255.1 Fructose-1,6-bisphosphatase [Klebsormidium nitens]